MRNRELFGVIHVASTKRGSSEWYFDQPLHLSWGVLGSAYGYHLWGLRLRWNLGETYHIMTLLWDRPLVGFIQLSSTTFSEQARTSVSFCSTQVRPACGKPPIVIIRTSQDCLQTYRTMPGGQPLSLGRIHVRYVFWSLCTWVILYLKLRNATAMWLRRSHSKFLLSLENVWLLYGACHTLITSVIMTMVLILARKMCSHRSPHATKQVLATLLSLTLWTALRDHPSCLQTIQWSVFTVSLDNSRLMYLSRA